MNKTLEIPYGQNSITDYYALSSSFSNVTFAANSSIGFRLEISSSHGGIIGITGSFLNNITSSLIISTSDSFVVSSSNFIGFYDEGTYATGSNSDEIYFSTELSRYYGQTFIQDASGDFQTSGEVLTKYTTYGDINNTFLVKDNDLLVIKTSKTSLEYPIVQTGLIDSSGRYGFKVDKPLYQQGSGVFLGEITEFIILRREKDETNAILSFTKPTGKTSYGFLIPRDLNPDVLKQIDKISKEINLKLLNSQQFST